MPKKEITIEAAKKIVIDLKYLLPEFAIDVNHYYTNDIDNFNVACSAYIKAARYNIPLEEFYDYTQINRGYEVARDTISIIASVDPDYNGRSFYGAFCDAYSMYKRGSEFKLYTEDDIVYSSINDL